MIFDHFNINTPQPLLEQVKDFYCTIFDLTTGFRPKLHCPGYWLYYQDHAIIHLNELTDDIAHSTVSYLDHLAFNLTNLPAFEAKLTEHNIPVTRFVNNETKVIQLFIRDPAGTHLECKFKQNHVNN